jgi:uncharacterized protein YbgA (DUF1722 family)/uncharacterized protein YbbK (DUF523 family)
MEKIKIGISACLLGEKVRYDGGHKLDHYITNTLGRYFDWFPVCPEVESGLPVPREAMHLQGNNLSPLLVTVKTGIDHTERLLTWSRKKLNILEQEDLRGFIFKGRSPSSGIEGVTIYTPSGTPGGRGAGLFGGVFMHYFPLLPVIDDGRLHDPKLRENFIERVFVYNRWKDFLRNGTSIHGLVNFHAEHKLLIFSHSPKHLSALGRLVAYPDGLKQEDIFSRYIDHLMEGLRLLSTVKKNTNVLLHIAGYFKKKLSSDEKRELLEVIERYHRGYVPLIVPIVLVNHYVRKFDEPYLRNQHYLHPHPLELMLRNHV